ncbi:LysM peptidoglycan-binding domain-containing M23 family metallopeptidase [Magnetospirillum sp. UT-4]|uniref:LysM peptidoglycan-binding domain-containing M23 family metallopeptidase n=1 Tax=Magnetospirillum sp. UT-4 TaxID=2681467 RepID=UPI0020C59D6D|nr:LysM peptidoglycan-binding domain-containing M23 family metallopeptidase [Magnetospirillum sp. UT-4]
MKFLVPAVVLPWLLAGCEPTWQGRAPVTRGAVSSGCGGAVTVTAGDTVYGVARRCNVSVRAVIEANNLQPPYLLTPGLVLRIPGAAAEYVVRRGDTLLVLARRLKVDFATLAQVNNKRPPYTIYVGEKLRVPGSHGGTTTVATAPGAGSAAAGVVIASPNAPGAARPSPRPLPQPSEAPAQAPAAEARHVAFQPQRAVPAEPPALAGRGFVWPVRGEVVAEFGPLAKGQHNDGINIAAPRGTPVRAAENGVVAYSGNELKGFGNLLLVRHADGWMSAYAHNDQLMVRKGDQVRKGQQIATVGSTGSVNSPQLHFELRRGTEAVNPADHLHGEGA